MTAIVAAPAENAADNYAPIVFVGGQAKLGAIVVGRVTPHSGGRRVQAYWTSYLPNGRGMSPAPDLETAMSRLVDNVRDWFAACGHPLPK